MTKATIIPIMIPSYRGDGRTLSANNTAQGCHLDADMVHHALLSLDLEGRSLLFIENVGNLVCPAMFDLGESLRVVVISITEGDDKPLKYPYIFESAQVCVIHKIDLLPLLEMRCRTSESQSVAS